MFKQNPQIHCFILLFSVCLFINANGQVYNPPVITSGGCTADSVIYTYTGAIQSFTVPSCVTSITIKAWGAGGGGGGADLHVGGTGGGGAYASSTISVSVGQLFDIVIGQGGIQGASNVNASGGGTGGFGGGNGGNGGAAGGAGSSGAGGGGGGATSILKAGAFVLVAGGGGGGGGGGKISAGAPGGGGGATGSVTSTTSYDGSGGVVGASTDSVGLIGGINASHDGGGGGGGGGGDNGSGGGGAPTNSCDCGAGGGAGGNNLGSVTINGHGQTPGDSTYPSFPTGVAKGGAGSPSSSGNGTAGGNGYVVVSYCVSTSIAITTASSNVLCYGANNGYAFATITAGTGPFTYSWNTTPAQTSDTAKSLSTGTYTVTVNNASNCPATATVTVNQPPVLGLNAGAFATTCNGVCNGSATVIPKGGTGSYTYLWSDNTSSTSAHVSNLCQGNYSVTVTDKNGCTHDTTVTVTQPNALTATHDSLPENGSCNGVAAVTISGGTSPYTYSWATGNQTSDTIKGQCQGTYCCTITDANKCTLNTCVTVNLFTGINNIINSSSIAVYPDPNPGYFTITGILPGELVELYDYTGQKLSSILADRRSFNFDISEKPDGIYFIKVLDKNGDFIEQKKIVKSK